MSEVAITRAEWLQVCKRSDLVANSGVCALVGDRQIALFFLPDQEPQLYAIDNWDPIANAGVIGRGLVAEIDGELTVASPLYKQHYRLTDGQCLEEEEIKLASFAIAFEGDDVLIQIDQ
ncbi:nitrite reductase small subunit NirD [Microbulbifer hydrolyticus]|uniref:NAD(P)H-dependent nitrite reductase small subunit n=1 Tax=Microbulbifer hydrolyticus TaxID=48074 RepID=A0A6P1TFM6_9GAMM|nr:nitrite reductase small subunit NirD [Microbulbifer hydrolyticus]MBB5212415.1 NAD(P)H-dependent nitrite reductase small subunit [Microbulbifer hydrolyticus]QHQ40049.1 nitrite reductase small subunit NirD [Microbulbifer hydrolyticus]